MRPILPLLLSSLVRRETPQELSHDRYIHTVQQMLDLNNTLNIQDPTYGLLVNSMASTGMGSVTDPNCLQLSIADCAFTNAKASNNITGLVASLIYRALERNTAAVGVASDQCTSFTPHNPELSTFKQHQDPASPGALANNKATVLELARQIYLVGGNPVDALDSGTFSPGDLSSDDKVGNSCNTADCIFDSNRLVRDASESEVTEYVAKCTAVVTETIGGGGSSPTPIVSNGSTYTISSPSNTAATTSATTSHTDTSTSNSAGQTSNTPSQPTSTTPQHSTTTTTARQQQSSTQQTSSNLQTFTEAYLGIGAPAVTGPDSSGKYHVDTDPSTFNTLPQAFSRSCTIQHNNCANAANQQKVSVSQCDTQLADCRSTDGY